MRRWGKFTIILAAWIGLLFFAVWKGGFAATFLSVSAGVLIAYLTYAQFVSMKEIHIKAKSDQNRYVEGDKANITVELQFKPLPFLWAGMENKWHRFPFYPGLRNKIEYSFVSDQLKRGEIGTLKFNCYVMDLFGWVVRKKEVSYEIDAIVYPGAAEINALPSINKSGGFGQVEQSRHGLEDVVPESIREYMPGDPMNRIHWKASAKMQTLQTKVPEKQGEHTSILVLDAASKIKKDKNAASCFEDCVRITAAILEKEWKQHRFPGLLLSQGSEIVYVPPGRQELKELCLKYLALCSQNSSIHAAELLHALPAEMRKHSKIICVIPSLPDDPAEAAVAMEQARNFHQLIMPLQEGSSTLRVRGRIRDWEQAGLPIFPLHVEKKSRGDSIA